MAGPYSETSIVMEFRTDAPTEFVRFHPSAPEGDRWLHRFEEFDADLDREEVLDRYALPTADEYRVSLVTVPAEESMQIGSVAALNDRSGGGDLVELLDRDAVPNSWVDETTSLDEFLERAG